MVAIPQDFWFSIASFMSGTGLGVHFGAVGGLIGALAQGSGKTQESKRITKLLAPKAPPYDPSVTMALKNRVSETSNPMIQRIPTSERTTPPIKMPIVHCQPA